ncbi:MAG: NAD(P)-binding domain-containing protein [bacterium]
MQPSLFDLIIVGAGPSGLACAIEAKKAGLSCLVLDQGSVVDAIRRFPFNMTFFSTAGQLEVGNIPFLCKRNPPALNYYRGRGRA